MDSVDKAYGYLQHSGKPYWWITSGKGTVATFNRSNDINESLSEFNTVCGFLPAGSYNLEVSDKENNRSTSLKTTFVRGTNQTPTLPANAQPMAPVLPSTNVYGISDAVYQKIQEEARQKILVEQMSEDFKDFMKEWPTYKKLIDKHESFLKDDNENGTPDFLETMKKGSETVKAAADIKKVFTGGNLFD